MSGSEGEGQLPLALLRPHRFLALWMLRQICDTNGFAALGGPMVFLIVCSVLSFLVVPPVAAFL